MKLLNQSEINSVSGGLNVSNSMEDYLVAMGIHIKAILAYNSWSDLLNDAHSNRETISDKIGQI